MNKSFWLGLTAALFTCSGCFTPGESGINTPPATVRALTPPAPPVTPEMVTPANIRQIAQGLEDEVEREEHQNMLTPSFP